MSQSDCTDVQVQKEQTEQKGRDKASIMTLSITVTELFLLIRF